MSAPKRLLDDASVTGKLKADLELARDNPTGHYDVAAGADAFGKALKTNRIPTFSESAHGGISSVITGKTLMLGTFVLAVSAAGLVWLWPKDESPQFRPSSQTPSPKETSEDQARPLLPPTPSPHQDAASLPSIAPIEPVDLPLISPNAKDPRPIVRSLPSNPTEKGPPAFMDEVAHLKRVRTALKTSPEQALRLAQEGHKTFAGGLLHEERDGLLILALQRLGRHSEASERSEQFKSRYPRSALLPQILAGNREIVP
jgi:hypothetical protein